MEKEFTVRDTKAFEQLLEDVNKANMQKPRSIKESPSLKYGADELKQFSFR